jgi:hypothetical protein
MATPRGARALLTLTVLATCVGVPAASAQQPDVQIRLVGQTPWTSADRPKLTITFDATNSGTQTIGSLSAGLSIGPPVRARILYEQTLANGPGPIPIRAETFPQTGVLAPGVTRRFRVAIDVSSIGDLSTVDSLVYPAQVGLLSASVPVATVNTAEINFVQAEEPPLFVSWWAEITAPVALDPTGTLADPRLETAIRQGGPMRSEVEALQRVATDPPNHPVSIAMEPAVLEQLSRMADGYATTSGQTVPPGVGGASDAAKILADLRKAAGGRRTSVFPMPFAAPLLPSLMSNGLARDLDRQWALGDRTVSKTLGATPDATVMRPPGGALDDASVDALSARGVTTILGSPGTVFRKPQPNDFAPPPTVQLTTRTTRTDLVLPDPSVNAFLGNDAMLADPVRAAQAILGEIATIWREEPTKVRGIAIGLPAGLTPGLWGPLLQRLAEAPFLHNVKPSTFAATFNVTGAQETLTQQSQAGFSHPYTTAIRQGHDQIASYRSMLTAPSALPDRLDRNLLYSEAGQYVGDEAAGRAWIDQVRGYVENVFASLGPNTSQTFTLTSSGGRVPIRMGDPGPVPLTVVVRLQSSRFSFPGGDTKTVTLERRNQIVEFGVRATASGQGVIRVIVQAPTGRLIDQGTLLVRSTAVSRIALIITAAAALGLAALWSRRLFRRPGS